METKPCKRLMAGRNRPSITLRNFQQPDGALLKKHQTHQEKHRRTLKYMGFMKWHSVCVNGVPELETESPSIGPATSRT